MEILKNLVNSSKCTLLCVGPMSKNFVDASIEYSRKINFPLMLIASRRQIDSEAFGGGYVNNWSTESFSDYIKKKNAKNILLCRDHGGPYQGAILDKSKNSKKIEMENAKLSFKSDIDSGFKIIHIDPSLYLGKKPFEESINRLFELYEYCWAYSRKKNKKISFEIGTEEQNGSTNSPYELEKTLELVKKFCKKNKIPPPSFVVVQSGTLVKEMENVGTFDLPFRVENQLPAEISVPQMIKICEKNNIMMKAHNCDYLSDHALQFHPRLGIHAINVAPEFGVIESRTIYNLLKKYNLRSLLKRFIDLSFNSMKLEKWMKENSKANKIDKALIAGHYIFSNDEFLDIFKETENFLKKKKININKDIKKELKKSISRYAKNLGLEN